MSSDDFTNLYRTIDKLSAGLEITDDERTAMSSQLTRIHDWVEKAAKRLDLKFE